MIPNSKQKYQNKLKISSNKKKIEPLFRVTYTKWATEILLKIGQHVFLVTYRIRYKNKANY